MVGSDADTNNSPSQNNDINSYLEYLKLAAKAQASGDVVLALHLYLAAYERSLQDTRTPAAVVIDGLRKAWGLACESKERSLAEYIFEKLEPYLTGDEISQYAAKLQRLALDKLEEFGLSREDLEDMTDVISQDFFGADPSSMFMRVEQGMASKNPFGDIQRGLVRTNDAAQEPAAEEPAAEEPASDSLSQNTSEKSEEPAQPSAIEETSAQANQPKAEQPKAEEQGVSQTEPENVDASNAHTASESHEAGEQVKKAQTEDEQIDKRAESIFNDMKSIDSMPGVFTLPGFAAHNADKELEVTERLTYKDLVGYNRAIETMRNHGIGIQNDSAFKELIELLNSKHGLSKMPITDVYLFRSPVREDANQFMLATMGEIDMPVIRMRMEENLQGVPVLCVMATPEQQPRLNTVRTSIDSGGVLILEDIDLWAIPLMESSAEDMGGFFHAQLSRGAREAMNLIKSAIENPDVYVFMSASKESNIDALIYDTLSPLTVVDIEAPDDSERAELWANILSEHPSLEGIAVDTLVQFSARMSRFDIYMAAREAVEEAYKASLAAKKYVPVGAAELYEKIAAYQPLESHEYRQLENAVVESFSHDLDDLLNE
ncbi:MAG: ribonucleotide reductase subunit alpha [Raoultibacter sp.]|jgi:hypothetical protein